MCGIVGVSSPQGDAAALTYGALLSLQHRGQESWGIATVAPGAAQTEPVASVRRLGRIPWPAPDFVRRPAAVALGHTRYSTTGGPSAANAQPLHLRRGSLRLAIAHNGNIINAEAVRERLARAGFAFESETDSEVVLALLASTPGSLVERVSAAATQLQGAYSVVAVVGRTLIAFRDPCGFRPLTVARCGDATVFASETCALDHLGCEDLREVARGEVVVIRSGGTEAIPFSPPAARRFCSFEPIYLARRDSWLGGERVGTTRERLGRLLAAEAAVEADVVVAVPNSGIPAARGYAAETGLRLVDALVRNEYVGRTFIEPTQELRRLAIGLKFNVATSLTGSRVVLVDDSIVRGSTMRHLVRLLFRAGAEEVHLRIASPPLVAPCRYGVDIADTTSLIAAGRDPDAVGDLLGATSLRYLSLASLHAAIAPAGDGLCTSCFVRQRPAARAADTRVAVPAG